LLRDPNGRWLGDLLGTWARVLDSLKMAYQKRIRKLELQVDSMAVVKSILFPRLLMEVPLDRG